MLHYESPTLDIMEIQLEEGIVRTSSEVRPEQSGGPLIEGWIDNENINGDFEL